MFELLLLNKKKLAISLNFGIYAGGSIAPLDSTDRYDYLTDTVATTTSLGVAFYESTGCSNGMIGALINAQYLIRYTFANATVVRTSKSFYGGYQSSSGNYEICVVHGGYIGGNWGTSTRLYTYATGVVALSSSSKQLGYGLTGTGNAQLGLHCGSYYSNLNKTQIVNYSNLVWAYGTNMSVGRHLATSFGTDALGVIVAGKHAGTSVDLYGYTTNAVTPGQALSVLSQQGATAGNKEIGVLTAGWIDNSASSVALKYTMSSGVWSTGTSLSQQRRDHCASSSSPGWMT